MYQEQEVRAGMSLLDAKNPGWEEKFDPTTLDLFNPYHCTLGQVYGDYLTGLRELGIGPLDARKYGFNISAPFATMLVSSFRDLTETWRHLVKERHEHVEVLSIHQHRVPVLV